ncbi:hypothetical protein [Arsenophonus sp. PmNCSU2021_1]|uniref:hypothetical protein n=1 Tax=Arsenophonus sp. PmNCSU2021_1 TaxID=3118989 RepID=UPI002FEF7B13
MNWHVCGGNKNSLKDHNAKRVGETLEIDILEHEVPKDLAEIWIEKRKDKIIDLDK